MDPTAFDQLIDDDGNLGLAWAGSTSNMTYLNLGDALSPVMVALCAGYPIIRRKFHSQTPRLAAVGTIGHGLEGGRAWTWGTGTSSFRNPGAATEDKVLHTVPADTDIRIAATRGPISAAILSGGTDKGGVYGDPVWLLPRFYRPHVEKTWELGVILHLSELTSRDYGVDYIPAYRRYDIAAADRNDIHLISTVTPISAMALKDKIDEILACKRIVSTSLHGMVIAEAYGIPCLYFAPNGRRAGLATAALTPDSGLDLRILDLYQGLGLATLPVFHQPRGRPTDWGRLIETIDRQWTPKTLPEDALLEAFPLPRSPIAAEPGRTIWEHPLIQSLAFQHDVAEINAWEKKRLAELGIGAPAPAPAPRKTGGGLWRGLLRRLS